MKICPNTNCKVFGRIVYDLTARCPLCKWDLKPALPASEVARPPAEKRAAASRP
jgi:hypothetical protein